MQKKEFKKHFKNNFLNKENQFDLKGLKKVLFVKNYIVKIKK